MDKSCGCDEHHANILSAVFSVNKVNKGIMKCIA